MKQTNDNVKTFSSSEARKILIAMRQGRWRETIGLLEPLAESGNSEAMYWMGERLQVAMRILNPDASSKRKYIMIRADKEKAWMWMERSAEKDYPKALFWLGYQYYTGRLGCEKNEEKAFTYFERAAQLGNIPATYYLSQCYQYARGTRLDHDKSISLCKQAAIVGYPKAEYELSRMYLAGRDVENSTFGPVSPNPAKAFEWCEKSADHGYVVAIYKLGEYYLNGTGVEKDLEKAAFWLRKAANRHLVNAKELLDTIEPLPVH